jgi:hypothetical protein
MRGSLDWTHAGRKEPSLPGLPILRVQVDQERNTKLASAFDDLRRSTAFLQLAGMRSLGLLTDDECAGFSDETREIVALMTRT